MEDVPQREIDWHRGFFAGAIFVLTRPEMAERSLETAARMAYVAAQEELLTAEEGESPYA